jgi:hypothetical protein
MTIHEGAGAYLFKQDYDCISGEHSTKIIPKFDDLDGFFTGLNQSFEKMIRHKLRGKTGRKWQGRLFKESDKKRQGRTSQEFR